MCRRSHEKKLSLSKDFFLQAVTLLNTEHFPGTLLKNPGICF